MSSAIDDGAATTGSRPGDLMKWVRLGVTVQTSYVLLISSSAWTQASTVAVVHVPRIPVPLLPEVLGSMEPIVLAALVTCLVALLVPTVADRHRQAAGVACACLAALMMADIQRMQPQMQICMSLMLVIAAHKTRDGDAAAAQRCRIILGGCYLWSGLHKINPRFVANFNFIMDPPAALMLGDQVVEDHKRALHLFGALSESTAGILAICKDAQYILTCRPYPISSV